MRPFLAAGGDGSKRSDTVGPTARVAGLEALVTIEIVWSMRFIT